MSCFVEFNKKCEHCVDSMSKKDATIVFFSKECEQKQGAAADDIPECTTTACALACQVDEACARSIGRASGSARRDSSTTKRRTVMEKNGLKGDS